MTITQNIQPSHPHEHELELIQYKKYFRCDRCNKNGFGSRYRCEKCDYDLHEGCMFSNRITSHSLIFQGSSIQNDIATTIKPTNPHPSHPRHELELIHCKKSFECNGCNKKGFGSRYRCEKCDYDLHEGCMFSNRITSHSLIFQGSSIQNDIATTIKPTNPHPSHPRHELKLIHCKKSFECNGCNKKGFGSRYRCEKCDYDLHEGCMFNNRITSHSLIFQGSSVQNDIATTIKPTNPHPSHPRHELELIHCKKSFECNGCNKNDIATTITPTNPHPSHPDHELELKHFKKPYTCDGCKEQGFGSRYRCEECNYDLHKDCMFNNETTSHEFFKGSTFKFYSQPSEEGKRYCDACGRAINGFVYHSKEKNLYLHPCCLKLQSKMVIDDVDFQLRKTISSKCIWCNSKTLKGSASRIGGWSYMSNCENYHFHVHCATEMVAEGWKTADGDDNALALENLKLQLQRRGDGNGGKGGKYWKIVKVILKTIAAILLGDPTLVLTSVVIDLITSL